MKKPFVVESNFINSIPQNINFFHNKTNAIAFGKEVVKNWIETDHEWGFQKALDEFEQTWEIEDVVNLWASHFDD